MAMTVVLLIRHASNDYVKEGRLAGWTPGVHLNARGQREADALARRVNHIPLVALYSSPLERAVETAQAVGFCQHLPVQLRPGLGEMQIGEWTGKLIRDLEKEELWKQVQSTPSQVRIPGGESFLEMQHRMAADIDSIVAAHPNQVVAVFSHSDPLKAAIAHYLGMDLNQFQRIVVNPASVTIFLFGEHSPFLFRLNDTGALPDFKPEPPKKENASESKEQAHASEAEQVEHAPESPETAHASESQHTDRKEEKGDA